MLYIKDLSPNYPNLQQFEIFKPYGLTPKDVIDEIIKKTSAKKATFNGRLDPMACGCMRVYLDNACHLSQLDTGMDKIYRFKMALGIESSSHDLLGFPALDDTDELIIYKIEPKINSFLNTLKTKYIQELPHFSSFRVANRDGVRQPLWWWKKNNKILEVQVPSFERNIYDFKIIGSEYIPLSQVAKIAMERISSIRLNHEFYQQDILHEWHQFLEYPATEIAVFEMQVSVSSGFYVRKLVEDIGLHIGLKTITIEIERLAYFQSPHPT